MTPETFHLYVWLAILALCGVGALVIGYFVGRD